ncbi:MAG: hypothetical protein ABIT83_06745 [Massilia sp.]
MKSKKLVFCAVLVCPLMSAFAGEWVLREDGIGPLRVGMRFDQVNKRMDGKLVHDDLAVQGPPYACELISAPGHPGISLMFVEGVLKRVDVLPDGKATVRGIAVGDPVSRVSATYPHSGEVKDFYDAREQNITVRSKDRALAIQFGTDQGKVAWLRAGAVKEVNYVEGCL